MIYHIDYETFSELDLPERGAYRYAEDPTTEILMLAISDGGEPLLWVNPKYAGDHDNGPAYAMMDDMVHDRSAEIWAHNAQFEAAITKYRWELDIGLTFPREFLKRLRCTAALCRRCGLPFKLETVGEVLNLSQKKDKRGSDLIKQFTMPNFHKLIGTYRVEPNKNRVDFLDFGDYCLQDVRTEMELHKVLEPFAFKGEMLRSFIADQYLNDRGFPVNVAALQNADYVIMDVEAESGQAFMKLTGGLRPSQRDKIRDLLADKGLVLPDMQADTVENTLEKPMPKEARAILELYATLQFAAVKKVRTMLNRACRDGRVRGEFLWYGAGTGRWSARGVQPHNFKRPTFRDTDLAYDMIRQGCSADDLSTLWGSALDVLSSCIRHFVQPREGKRVLDVDYNAIEARIVCWLAGQQDAIDRYIEADNWTGPKEDKPDPYKDMAARIYETLANKIDKDEREVGKRAVLGCGYNMGGEKFQLTCLKQYGIVLTRDLADSAVAAYREKYHMVTALWKGVERAARSAIAAPGRSFRGGPKLVFTVKTVNGIPFLFMKLPSGRSILYPYPELREKETRFGKREVITFMSSTENGWKREDTYGGKLVENATQGVAADVMGCGASNATDQGFCLFMLVHDQALSEIEDHLDMLDAYVATLTDLPPWAEGLPIKAEGKNTAYYKKG